MSEENKAPEGNPEEGEVVTLKREDYDKFVKDSEAKENLVSEIKDLREKKQLSESEAEELRKKVEELSNIDKEGENAEKPVIDSTKIDELIEQRLQDRLSKKEVEDRAVSKQEAIRKFKESNKEFHEDNDEGGLKFSALEKKLSMFNTDNVRSTEEFLTILNSAKTLMGGGIKKNDEQANPYANTPSEEGHSVPVEDKDKNLTPVELKLIERSFGGDKGKYLEQKAKRPDFVENLLRHATNY